MKKQGAISLRFGVLLVAGVVLFLANLWIGSVHISFAHLLGFNPMTDVEHKILWTFRFPKALTALTAGAALAVCGLQMQTFFRNPLAGPFILGITSGASLGVALVVLGASAFSAAFLSLPFSIGLAAAVGSSLVLLLIMLMALRVKDVMTLLIVGIMLGTFTSAIVSILQYFASAQAIQRFLIWGFGSLGSVDWHEMPFYLLGIGIGLFIALLLIRPLNILLLGERYAESMGLSLKLTRGLIILSTGLLAGLVTAFCGPIAFVGLGAPHVARLYFKTSNHAILMPGVMLWGGVILLGCNLLSIWPWSDAVLPINAITAILGAPLVFWLVFSNKKLQQLF